MCTKWGKSFETKRQSSYFFRVIQCSIRLDSLEIECPRALVWSIWKADKQTSVCLGNCVVIEVAVFHHAALDGADIAWIPIAVLHANRRMCHWLSFPPPHCRSHTYQVESSWKRTRVEFCFILPSSLEQTTHMFTIRPIRLVLVNI